MLFFKKKTEVQVECLPEVDSQEKSGLEYLRDLTERNILKDKLQDIIATVPNSEMYMAVSVVIKDELQSEFGVLGYINGQGDFKTPSYVSKDIIENSVGDNLPTVFTRHFILKMKHWGKPLDEDWNSFYENDETEFKLPEKHVPIKNLIIAPVVFRGLLIGMIVAANKKENYTDKDLSIAKRMAEQIAPVLSVRLERDTLKEQVQSLLLQREEGK